MPVETWYLSQKLDNEAKQLESLEGWRKEFVQLLLSDKDDETIKSNIKEILSPDEMNQDEVVKQTVALIPKKSRSKAHEIAQRLTRYLRIDENGRIVYPDGSFGSAFVDAIKYLTAPKSGKNRAPFDLVKLTSFLDNTNDTSLDTGSDIDDRKPLLKKWVVL